MSLLFFRNFIGDLDDDANLFDAGAGRDVVFGLGGDDTILGGKGADALFGDEGADALAGGKGRDLLFGGDGSDALAGEQGRDVLFGGDGDDQLSGGQGRDVLIGDAHEDTLDGGAGRDVLRGGTEADVLTGGGGRDYFAYANGEGGDTITDFNVHRDAWTLDSDDFGIAGDKVQFQNVARTADDDVNADLVDLEAGNNVYVLQGVWNNAVQAASALSEGLAEQDADEGALFFVYYNINLDVNRLFHIDDISFNEETQQFNGSLQQLSNLGEAGALLDENGAAINDLDAIASLADFSGRNFVFDDVIG